ncbi:germination protein YpeB [Hydrogenoanaerobacterium saccharovorans]|uniref:Germination protein YpeB n=1 Tax=Hydrogenoanaerobacterium saccharovorans TaxID=474960 RepID=A0A1H8BSG4_9FIRM|nr:germination protein YpeB [Hydrogenoanaerobacterium saccharovorans]RPF47268.1 germination protein YpeB [Hydrogenoanaerobacterium saccharovorans]SEM85529.1 germination protein YpeB [Hydrogenoanaerobacterium saccharovorans]
MENGKSVHLNFTKRGWVRIVSYLCAVLLVLGVGTAVNFNNAVRYRILLEDTYSQSITGLASNLTGISSTLSKGLYASTPVQVSSLSAQLWRDASAAKTALTSLPVGELHLDNTNRFLSQIGDYAMTLSKKSVSGGEISEQERKQFAALCEYGRKLSDQLFQMEQNIIQGQITMEQIKKDIENTNKENGAEPQSGETIGSFEGLEKSFTDYPELEYDGPFSDHILKREPQMLKGAAQIPYEEAQKLAAKAAQVEYASLKPGSDENSTMPSYTFNDDDVWVGVTKAGGFVVYVIKSRIPQATTLTTDQAIKTARTYLEGLNLKSLTHTYYQIKDNQCTINFAHTQGGVTIYPDLVKVTVAMDNGEILGFDARGYISNHYNRTITTPKLSLEQAKQVVDKKLKIESNHLVIIPTTGQFETYCYEFTVTSETGDKLLIYINADTGVEEQILILTEDENGRITR